MFNPASIYKELVSSGDAWSESNAAADLLEETRKTLIAELQTECPEKTISAKEMYALGHKTYREHIQAMVAARKVANRDRVKWESVKIYAELLRTQAATERAANRSAT